KNKVTIHYAFPILAGLAVFIYVNNPTKKLPSKKTVIKGFVPENETITALYLLDGNMNDTLVTIPVVNQQLNKALPNNFTLKNYLVTTGLLKELCQNMKPLQLCIWLTET